MEDYYPFKVSHVLASVEDMDSFFVPGSFDIIIYTSSIEHMQKKVGEVSLSHCLSLLKTDGTLFLSCPNTTEKKDPYDTQYAAHLYEWSLDELLSALKKLGFRIKDVFGLVAKVRDFERFVSSLSENERKTYVRMKQYFPTPWLMAIFPILYPEAASEVLILAAKPAPKTTIKRRTLLF